jgi:hypothetical protein
MILMKLFLVFAFASSIAKCNTWGSHAILSVYAKTI